MKSSWGTLWKSRVNSSCKTNPPLRETQDSWVGGGNPILQPSLAPSKCAFLYKLLKALTILTFIISHNIFHRVLFHPRALFSSHNNLRPFLEDTLKSCTPYSTPSSANISRPRSNSTISDSLLRQSKSLLLQEPRSPPPQPPIICTSVLAFPRDCFVHLLVSVCVCVCVRMCVYHLVYEPLGN